MRRFVFSEGDVIYRVKKDKIEKFFYNGPHPKLKSFYIFINYENEYPTMFNNIDLEKMQVDGSFITDWEDAIKEKIRLLKSYIKELESKINIK